MKPTKVPSLDMQLHTEPNGINLLSVYRSMLRIVARWGESEYTDSKSLLRQTAERELDDLADPASDADTSQG